MAEGVMVPGLGGFIDTCGSINYDGFSEGHGGVLVDFCIGSDVARGFGNGE